jgi:small GTP-binding protein
MNKSNFLKLIVVGETEVGKTCLVSRWCEGVFPRFDQIKTTIGAAFTTKEHAVEDSSVTLQVWDFAGQSHFADVMFPLIRGAKAGLLVFDLSKPSTIDILENFWIPTLNKLEPKLMNANKLIVVANKLDLIDENNGFHILNELEQFCEKYNNLKYVSVSAKTGENIDKLEKLVDEKIKSIIAG